MPNAKSFIAYMGKYYAKNGYKEGANNKNQFSDVVNAYGLNGCQNQPWCATYQFALELFAFGKSAALSHWNMSTKDYCGYSVFETEAKFKAAGKLGTEPKVGALVIFKKSHMGRVISLNKSKKTFQCAEGNSGDACVVKTYSWTDSGIKSFCLIDYGDDKLTMGKLEGAVLAAYEMAHYMKWPYGDSHTTPPCLIDKRISCDRLEALACFILGYTEQQAGGFVTTNMEKMLLSWGWKKITKTSDLRCTDFILMKKNGQTVPTWEWHAFTMMQYVNDNNIDKYDTGSTDRIKQNQPYHNVPLNEWKGSKSFYCGFRAPYEKELEGNYVIETAVDRKFCIDARKEDTNIQLWREGPNAQQKFTLEQVGGGFYRIKVMKNGKVLDVVGGKAKNGQNVQQYTWNGTKAQKWRPVKNSDGSYTFESALNKQYVLDLRGAKAVSGQNIYIYRKNNTAAQKWFLKKL